ncbi:zinc finger protein OZF-like isoform X2 [Macrobrachium nipponense]|uniref:zinc finger protein OZF-like isoform X2 n=1 Tax=Macrobrachium nipponense TaxID=159736 RepID=UPI0030C85B49
MNAKAHRDEEEPQAKGKSFSTSQKSCKDGRKPSSKISPVKPKYHVNEKSYTCNTCGKEFKRKDNLTVHFRVHTGEKNYVCSVCGKKFAYKSALKDHHRIHTGEKNYVCGICEKKFAHKCNLISHIKTHEAKFPCEICGKEYRYKITLGRHVKDHDKIETIKINENLICNKSNIKFAKKDYLRRQASIHAAERRFVCEYCGKKFRYRSNLSVHATLHTGERRFSCEECGKRFSQKSHLRVHARTHTGEKNYICGECGKGFNIKSHLNYHIRIHTGEMNYACEVCGKRFYQKSGLTWHNKHHTHKPEDEKKVREQKEKASKAKDNECDIYQEKFPSGVILNTHRESHDEKTNSSTPITLKEFNSEMLAKYPSYVVEEIHTVISDIEGVKTEDDLDVV